jgi:uncharacterized Tic20 family protein
MEAFQLLLSAKADVDAQDKCSFNFEIRRSFYVVLCFELCL